jgi:hypothetical protein
MWSQTITPTSHQLTVEIPDAFLNQPVEIVLIPRELSDDLETRRRQIDAFFDQFQADVSLLRFSREELYER